MSTTLTIRNLDEEVKRKLRIRAAHNQTSMEAEARSILADSLADQPTDTADVADEEAARLERIKRIEAVRGIWADRMEGKSTDEWMKEMRGDD